MRVSVTGAAGHIGSAVVRELIDAGHVVLGLTRSGDGVAKLKAAGAEAYRGDLDDVDSLRGGVDAADGVIHQAFKHDFANFKASLAAELTRTGRPRTTPRSHWHIEECGHRSCRSRRQSTARETRASCRG
jgi:uncharacterized protein YbjT (DUF2867 family)